MRASGWEAMRMVPPSIQVSAVTVTCPALSVVHRSSLPPWETVAP